jgi:hypothetical protein
MKPLPVTASLALLLVSAMTIQLTRRVMAAVAVSFACAFLCGCGTGTGSSGKASVSTQQSGSAQPAAFEVLVDDYGVSLPNLLYLSDNSAFWCLEAAQGRGALDPDFKSILRIDLPKSAYSILTGGDANFSLGSSTGNPRFPGSFLIFNRHSSTLKCIESGTISFSFGTGRESITITFDVEFSDPSSRLTPAPRYHLKGRMRSATACGAQTIATGDPGLQVLGEQCYDAKCSGCHALGAYNNRRGTASDLSERGGELPVSYPGADAVHRDLVIADCEMWPLRVMLNAW